MRVLLVNPRLDHAFAKVGFVMPPLGIGYLAAYLKRGGHEVTLHDMQVDETAPDYSRFDMVGVSGDTPRHKLALETARAAKDSGATTVIGGPHVSFLDEETASLPYVDFVVRGEGELTVLGLADALEAGKDPSEVDGLTFVREGVTVRTPDRPPIEDLDSMPFPARELMDMDSYRTAEMAKRKMTSIISSRGCPSGCDFCSSSRFNGRKWRARSVENLIKEIKVVTREYGFGGVAFLDDNLTLDPRRVIELSKAIIDEGIDVKWWCFSRVSTVVKNPDMVVWMGRSGCRYVFMGIESPRQETLDGYSKKSSASDAQTAVKTLKRHGIETLGAYILGAPDETREMIRETIDYSLRLDTGGVQYTLLTPYPGTVIFEKMKDRLLTDDWALFDCSHPVIRSDHLDRDELASLYAEAYRSFYMRPKRVLISLLSFIRGRGVKLSVVKGLIKDLSGNARA